MEQNKLYGIFVSYEMMEVHYELYSVYSSKEEALSVLEGLRENKSENCIDFTMEEILVGCERYFGKEE